LTFTVAKEANKKNILLKLTSSCQKQNTNDAKETMVLMIDGWIEG